MQDIQLVAKYVGLSLLSKNMTVTPLKLQKILYYLQAWNMVFLGRENTLFADVPQAWVNGPVYPAVFHAYKGMVPDMCQRLEKTHFGVEDDVNEGFKQVSVQMNLNAEQMELLESVILLYGAKSQNELIFLTHSEKPWAEQREGVAPYERCEKPISLDTMYSYYKERHDRNRTNA